MCEDRTKREIHSPVPALGGSVQNVCLVVGTSGFYSRSGHTNDFESSIRSFPPGAWHKRKCEGLKCMCVVRLVRPVTTFNHSSSTFVMGRQLRMGACLAPAVPYLNLNLKTKNGSAQLSSSEQCKKIFCN